MADNIDDDEVRYLSSNSVVNKFGGEDLCERADIYRKNGYDETTLPLNNYNEGFIEKMIEKEPNDTINKKLGEYELESIVQSIIDLKVSDSNSSSEQRSDEDDIEELFDDPEKSVNWTPNVYKKPTEEEFLRSCYSSIIDLEDSMFSCLSFDSVAVEPYESVQKAFSFYKSFLYRLKRLECQNVRLELFLWPKIVKQISITCVSGPKSGKTNSYLVPLMNWFDSREAPEPKEDISIGSIVVCSSTRQTYEIARQAKQWRDPSIPSMEQTIRIISMNSTNEKKQLTSILNGCDILITTPGPLLRFMNSSLIDCSTTKAIIIDEGDITLALHMKTIQEIYLSYARNKKNTKRFIQKNGTVSNPMAFQTMIFTQKWTKEIQWFSREVQHLPTYVFGSYYEISIALRVECRVEVIESEKCREKVVKMLAKKAINENSKRIKIAIVCRNEDEICFLRRHMTELIDSKLIKQTVEVSHNTPHYELETKRHKWNKFGGLLFITEDAIKIVSGFQSCYCIIHYKLPHNFTANFGERFRLMTKQFKRSKNPLETQNMPHLINYVVVSPTDSHISEVTEYLNRLQTPIPEKLISICDYQRRQLCLNFCSFGKCPLGSVSCPDRHEFNEYDRPLPELPINGQIKIVMTYVKGANQFYFRLQESRNENQTSGQWRKRDVIYDDIRSQLNALKDKPFNTVKEVCTETIYGIAIRAEVLRVRVIRLLGKEELQFYEEYDPNDKSEKVELFCIDFGHKLRSRSRQLFELSENLKSLPSFAFKAYLFGIKPIDNEIEWDFRATQKFYDLVENYRITQITVWILKQIDGVFWLNQMNVEKRLKNAKLKVESNPVQYLMENKFVDQNENRLPDVNTDYNQIINIWHNYRLNTAVYHSCLVDDSTYVVVTDFMALNHMYVMQESRVKRLEELENKWMTCLPSLIPLTEVTENHICFYRGTDLSSEQTFVNRAKVVAINGNTMDVFLVDHGETVTNVQKSNLFTIEESELKILPFQAIKVSLFGVKQIKPITYDLICELTRNEDNLYLMTIAHKLSYNNGVHCIRLFVSQNKYETHFVSLSKLLVDLNYAEYVDGEEDNDFEMNVDKEVNDPNEEIESEYIEQLEKYMAENMANDCCKDYLQKLGFDPEDLALPKPSTESRASKTIRRLKAIKSRTNVMTKKEESSDESDDEKQLFPKKIIPNTGEFDYEIDPNASVLCYDPNDLDDKCDFSDEDAILEEEELS